MNLGAVAALPLGPETRTWFRAVDPQFLPTALQTAHTTRVFSRYSPGPLGQPPFEILYLAENQLVALFEVQALFGAPTKPGALVPNPARTWVTQSVTVQLSAVADLTQALAQHLLETSAQELTGDWQGYQLRGPGTSVSRPIGLAPTQELGEALRRDVRQIEGFRAVSAKLPYHQVLGVFPQNLRAGSFVRFTYRDSSGKDRDYVVAPT